MFTPEAAPPSRPTSINPRRASQDRPVSSPDPAGGSCISLASCHPSGLGVRRGLWGWSPPQLIADTPLKLRVDRFMPRSGGAAVLFWAGFIAMVNVAPHLAARADLLVLGIATLVAGGWCALNFWRCRHAHCLVTGGGWLALSLFTLLEAGLGRSLISGREPMVLDAILAAGFIFEALWSCARGSNAVVPVPQ